VCACIDCLPAFVHAIADGVNEGGYHEPSLEPSTASRDPRSRTPSRNSPRTSKTASSISSFDACLGPSFINITLYPFYKLHIVLLQKHGRIATLDCYD
jgi:hypothetical protein